MRTKMIEFNKNKNVLQEKTYEYELQVLAAKMKLND